jgi:N-sulfoglucosamine sulfohydrolase
VERTAAEFLGKYDWKQPLMLQVGSLSPHVPWPQESQYQAKDVVLPPRFVDTPETRQDLARYYEEVSKLDSQIGQVLDALQRAGQERNTLVIYTSDQGAQLPFAKWCLYDEGLRTPLLARWPGRIKPGTVTDAMVSLVDLLPTCLEAAGAASPGEIDGRSFLGVLAGRSDRHAEIVFGAHSGQVGSAHHWWTPEQVANHYPIRSARTRHYRYVLNLAPNRTFNCSISGVPPESPVGVGCWRSWVDLAKSDPAAHAVVQAYLHRPLEELYDLSKDPGETRNVAGDPEYGEALTQMRVALHRWRQQQGDTVPVVWEPEPADRAGRVQQWKTQVQQEK